MPAVPVMRRLFWSQFAGIRGLGVTQHQQHLYVTHEASCQWDAKAPVIVTKTVTTILELLVRSVTTQLFATHKNSTGSMETSLRFCTCVTSWDSTANTRMWPPLQYRHCASRGFLPSAEEHGPKENTRDFSQSNRVIKNWNPGGRKKQQAKTGVSPSQRRKDLLLEQKSGCEADVCNRSRGYRIGTLDTKIFIRLMNNLGAEILRNRPPSWKATISRWIHHT